MRRLIIVGMGLLSRGVQELIASLRAVPMITIDDLAPDRDRFAYCEPKLYPGAPWALRLIGPTTTLYSPAKGVGLNIMRRV